MPHSVISFNASIAQPFDRSDRPPPLPSKVVRPGIAHHSKLETLQVPKHERSAEPTIQVTIGRVEVRAVVQPAGAAGKERSTSVVMSLDEYLRRRARGAGQ
jgi:hypothetical protein